MLDPKPAESPTVRTGWGRAGWCLGAACWGLFLGGVVVWCAFSAGTFIHLSAFNGEYGSGVTTGQVTAAAVQALFSALAYLSALVFGIWRTLRGPLRYQAEVLACMGLGSAPGHLFGFVVFTLTGMTKGIG